MISKKLAIDILNEATSTGADFVEIYYEDTLSKNVSLENGRVEGVGSNVINGVGIRLLQNNRSVYGYTNDLTKKGLFKLVSSLKASFSSKRIVEPLANIKKIKVKNIHKVEIPLESVSNEEIISYLKNASSIISNYDKRISRVIAGLAITHNDVTIFNSEGKTWNTTRIYGRLALSSIAVDEGKIESRFDGPGTQAGWEFFTKTLNIEKLAKEHAEKLILMLEAKECPAGKYPVVIGNGWGGVIFHEACGHQLEATSVAKGLSVFSGMKGQMIANPIVLTIMED